MFKISKFFFKFASVYVILMLNTAYAANIRVENLGNNRISPEINLVNNPISPEINRKQNNKNDDMILEDNNIVSEKEQPNDEIPVSEKEQPNDEIPVSEKEQPNDEIPVSEKEQPNDEIPGNMSREIIPVNYANVPGTFNMDTGDLDLQEGNLIGNDFVGEGVDLNNVKTITLNGNIRVEGDGSDTNFKKFPNIKAIKNAHLFDFSRATRLPLFADLEYLEELDVSTWNMSSVTNINRLFFRNRRLKELDVRDWDTSNVKSMAGAFSGLGLYSPIDLKIGFWDVSKTEDMNSMFQDLRMNTDYFDISKWDVSNVSNFQDMFNSAGYTENIDDYKKPSNILDLSLWKINYKARVVNMFQYSEFHTFIPPNIDVEKTLINNNNAFYMTESPSVIITENYLKGSLGEGSFGTFRSSRKLVGFNDGIRYQRRTSTVTGNWGGKWIQKSGIGSVKYYDTDDEFRVSVDASQAGEWVWASVLALEVKDSTLEYGETWNPADNFISARDDLKNTVTDFSKVSYTVTDSPTNTIDTTEPGWYEVVYTYEGPYPTERSKTANVAYVLVNEQALGSIKVQYLDDTGAKISKDTVIKDIPIDTPVNLSTNVAVTSDRKKIEDTNYYELNQVPEDQEAVYPSEYGNLVTYTYDRIMGSITIKYEDESKKEVHANRVINNLPTKDLVNVSTNNEVKEDLESIDTSGKYTLVSMPKDVTGVRPSKSGTTIIYTFKEKTGNIVVSYVYPDGTAIYPPRTITNLPLNEAIDITDNELVKLDLLAIEKLKVYVLSTMSSDPNIKPGLLEGTSFQFIYKGTVKLDHVTDSLHFEKGKTNLDNQVLKYKSPDEFTLKISDYRQKVNSEGVINTDRRGNFKVSVELTEDFEDKEKNIYLNNPVLMYDLKEILYEDPVEIIAEHSVTEDTEYNYILDGSDKNKNENGWSLKLPYGLKKAGRYSSTLVWNLETGP